MARAAQNLSVDTTDVSGFRRVLPSAATVAATFRRSDDLHQLARSDAEELDTVKTRKKGDP